MEHMPVTAKKKKDPAAVALGRKGGKKGGLARAAKLTPAERSESARKAVQARWAKTKTKRSPDHMVNQGATADTKTFSDTSDHAFMSLLKRYKATNDPTEMESLSEQIERIILHKQYENVKA
jgi:hypothetical protein